VGAGWPGSAGVADGDIAPVDVTSTDFARMADLVNLYKSLRWEPLMPRISLSPNRSGLTDARRWTAVTHGGPAEHADALTLPP
jgi:hypothetical protein